MNAAEDADSAAVLGLQRDARGQAALLAAYREGTGLAAVAVIRTHAGIRIAACAANDDGFSCAGEQIETRWWCRRRSDAEAVAAAATARLQRRHAGGGQPALAAANESIASAARQRNVALFAEEEVSAQAMAIIARVEEELERLRQSGDLKSVNRSYRAYRLEAAARGERVLRYADWMSKYKQKLVRELAAALRYA